MALNNMGEVACDIAIPMSRFAPKAVMPYAVLGSIMQVDEGKAGEFATAHILGNEYPNFGDIFIISIGDCAQEFLHIIKLEAGTAGSQLEILSYAEESYSKIQLLLKDHASGEYFLISDIVPSGHTLRRYVDHSDTDRDNTFKVRAIRMRDRRQTATSTFNVPASHFERIDLIFFAPKMTQTWVGQSDIIGVGTGIGSTWSGYIVI